jgi:AraC-like DNA-binding protein
MTDLHTRHPPNPVETPENFRIASSDMGQARAFLRDTYCPVAIEMPKGAVDFRLLCDVIRLGPLTIGQLQFSVPVDLCTPGLDGYHLTLPQSGSAVTGHAGHDVAAQPHRAAIFRPGRAVCNRYPANRRQLNVKIDKAALESTLEAMLGHPIDGPIDLPADMDLSTGPGRSWSRLIQLVRDEAEHHQGLLYQPLVAVQLRHGVLSGLLLALRHRYHDELVGPSPCGPPRAIRRAVDAIHSEPERAFCVADLALIAGMSVRSLQEGFRRHVGMSPMAYLQQIRLERAHDSLLVEHPQRVTVAAIAHRWGFTHLGRFARAYRCRYGVSPSDTLRTA